MSRLGKQRVRQAREYWQIDHPRPTWRRFLQRYFAPAVLILAMLISAVLAAYVVDAVATIPGVR